MGTRVVIMAGGTGGHVYPALAVAEELRQKGCIVSWLGTRRGLEARVVPAAGFEADWVTVAGIRGKAWHQRLTGPLLLVLACFQAFGVFRRRRPQVVVGMGGFVSGPGGIMARLLGIPLVVHEQNRVPGTTNRMLAKIAQVVLEAFPASFPPKIGARCTGNPLRRTLRQHPERQERASGERLRVLVVGGSQGAKVLNEVVPAALARLGHPCEARHQTGTAMRDETAVRYQRSDVPARVESFIEDMAEAYRWADIAVCRAGAMTVSELSAVGLPAVLIPYPFAIDDHQTANARFISEAGGAILIPQTELDADRLALELRKFCTEPGLLSSMAQRAHSLAKLGAAEDVAVACLAEATT